MNATLNYHTAYGRERRANGYCADCTRRAEIGTRCRGCAVRNSARERSRYAQEKVANSEWYQTRLRVARERQRAKKIAPVIVAVSR